VYPILECTMVHYGQCTRFVPRLKYIDYMFPVWLVEGVYTVLECTMVYYGIQCVFPV